MVQLVQCMHSPLFITEWPRLCLKIQLQEGTLPPTFAHGEARVSLQSAFARKTVTADLYMYDRCVSDHKYSEFSSAWGGHQDILKDMLQEVPSTLFTREASRD